MVISKNAVPFVKLKLNLIKCKVFQTKLRITFKETNVTNEKYDKATEKDSMSRDGNKMDLLFITIAYEKFL